MADDTTETAASDVTDIAHPEAAYELATVRETQAIPKYTKPHEVRAARELYGARYDKMVTNGVIDAPSRDELSDATLAAKLADDDAERTAHSEKRVARHAAKAEAPAKPVAKKPAAKKIAEKSAKKR